jgi:trigger factor
MDFIKDIKVTKEPNSQVKIEGEIPFAELEKHRQKAIAHLGRHLEVAGFRKGHLPEKVILERVGEMAVLSEMAERSLAVVYPEILKTHKVHAIGHPQINLTKIAPKNPLGFTAMVAVLPEVTLPDYEKIAATINQKKASTEVTDAEVEAQVKDILRQKLAYERLQAKAVRAVEAQEAKKAAGETADHTHEEMETHTHADGTVHAGPAHEEDEPIKDEELPVLTDEYVQTLGQPGQFATAADFKTKLKEHLAVEKEREITAAHRAKITDAIIEKTTMELPQILIDSEIEQMFAQMNEDLKRANLEMDDYLSHIKKTKADLQKEWAPAAEKRAKLQLVLNEIAKKDDIKPHQGQLDAQVDQLMQQYKDADETRVRIYVASVMTNEAVMQKLEAAK